MSRVQPRVDHVLAEDLRTAAVERFVACGYSGASVAAIAADVGVTSAVFYDHFQSKLDVLREIARATYATGVAQTEAAVSAAGADPRDRLDAAIWAQCDFAIRFRHAIRVIEAEAGQLDAGDLEMVSAAKVQFGRMLGEIIDDGRLARVFRVSGLAATVHALTCMCASIGSWYVPESSQSPRQIAETYCELASRMTGVAGVEAGRIPERRLVAVSELQTA